MFIDIQMEQNTVASSSSTAASPNKYFHVFLNHRGPDVKKTFASHLYHRLCSAQSGLRVFLDQPELRVGRKFDSQIKDAIRTASVHVAIFSPRYAESEWCLNELLYMFDSKALIIPVFYHVKPEEVRWTEGNGVYAEALRILENKKTHDRQTHEEKPRHDPATIKKWREALSSVSVISGLDLQAPPFNGDEGELVEKIIQRVLEEIKSISGFYCSQLYGGHGGNCYNDGTYSGIRRITMTAKDNSLTSVQLFYGLEGNENLKDKCFAGNLRGIEVGDKIEYSLKYPEEIVTKVSGYIEPSFSEITSLTFHTNERNLGPCGQQKGTYFETEVRGKIVGVFGSCETAVNSIGVNMLKPRSPKNEKFYCSQVYGGNGGGYRTDGTYSGIRRITMMANKYSLTSLQLHYGLQGDEILQGRYFPGRQHGGVVGIPHLGALGDRVEYNLNYPEEIVTKISGHFGSYKPWPECWDVIKSLTFHTNKGKYGPCGQEQGTYFETEEVGKIVGVFGSSGTLVDSIGVYILKAKSFESYEASGAR